MKIYGLQKLTLLDYPGKTACTIFLGGCNFRCPFCHNASLVLGPDPAQAIAEEELFSFLKKRVGLLDGICITGGEPLLSPDLESFLTAVRQLGYTVKLDTNGSFPKRLQSLTASGLIDYVAMDIKHAPNFYSDAAGITVGGTALFSSIDESVHFLLSGAVDYEFRTTLVGELHREEDMEAIGQWISGAKRYYLQKFVDSGDLVGTKASSVSFHPVSFSLARHFRDILRPHIPSTSLRGYDQ